MSTQKSKEELVRLAWISALRREGHRQCHGRLFKGTQVCALGILAEVTGLASEFRAVGWVDGDYWQRAGISSGRADEITDRNDGKEGYDKHTFSEIADVIEGWFK